MLQVIADLLVGQDDYAIRKFCKSIEGVGYLVSETQEPGHLIVLAEKTPEEIANPKTEIY